MTAAPYQAGSVPITGLPALPGYAIAAADEIAIVDTSASETKKIAAQAFVQGILDLMPAGSINGNLITFPETPDIDPNKIPDGSITAAKLADNSSCIVTSTTPTQGAYIGQLCMLPGGTVFIWDGSTWKTAAADLNVTGEDLADGSSGKWTETDTFPGDNGDFIGQIAVSTDGQGYMWNGTEWFALTAVPPDGSITGPKMADNSTAVFYTEGDSNLTGDFIGQLAIDDSQGMSYAWTGDEWISLTSADAAYTGQAGTIVSIAVDTETREISGSLEDATEANQFLAGPADAAGAIALRPIESSDLPIAAAFAPGAVSPGNTLEISETGELNLYESITPNYDEYHLVAYDEYGLVVDSAALADAVVLPPATTTDLGGIIVGTGLSIDINGLLSVDFSSNDALPIASETSLGTVIIGGGITVTGDGVISIDNEVDIPGTFTKVTINEYGLVTQGDVLLSSDIPDLDASKLTSGFIDPNRIGDKSIARRHLGDYSVTFIQETAPTLNVGAIGGFWLKESTGALNVFNGNRWVSVSGSGGGSGGGGGTDTTPGLRYGGLINGTTGEIGALTTEGASAGFVQGSAPGSLVTEDNVGVYFVASPGGDQIAEAPGQTFAVGDWLLAASESTGWTYVDRGSGGGGIDPSTIRVQDLADVAADSPLNGDGLIYNSVNQQYETRHIDINELGDVAVNNPQDNQVLTYTSGSWVNSAAPSGGAINSDAPSDGKQYGRLNQGWSEVALPELPENGQIPVVSDTPPASPTVGMVWVRPSNLRQYVYMTDSGGSSQWASLMCC